MMKDVESQLKNNKFTLRDLTLMLDCYYKVGMLN